MQALEKDFRKVGELVEEAVRQLSARGGGENYSPVDAVHAMESMNASHLQVGIFPAYLQRVYGSSQSSL